MPNTKISLKYLIPSPGPRCPTLIYMHVCTAFPRLLRLHPSAWSFSAAAVKNMFPPSFRQYDRKQFLIECHAARYIRLVQHLIEKCLTFHMDRDDCVRVLAKRANIQPVITNAVWEGLLRENPGFFASYFELLGRKRMRAYRSTTLRLDMQSYIFTFVMSGKRYSRKLYYEVIWITKWAKQCGMRASSCEARELAGGCHLRRALPLAQA